MLEESLLKTNFLGETDSVGGLVRFPLWRSLILTNQTVVDGEIE